MRLLKGLGNAEKFIVVGSAVKNDPASLADEAGAMALFGGARAMWIEPAGEEIVEGVSALLDAAASESAVVAVAGRAAQDLGAAQAGREPPRGAGALLLRPRGARHGARDRRAGARGRAAACRPTSPQRLAAAANSNQAIAASELEKFALYLGAEPGAPRDLDHDTLDLLSADAAEGDLLKLGDLALSGRMDALLDELGRLPGGRQ